MAKCVALWARNHVVLCVSAADITFGWVVSMHSNVMLE